MAGNGRAQPNQTWRATAALHGTYDLETGTFPSLTNIEMSALASALSGTGNVFTAADALKPVTWDASPDGNFKREWSRAAYFAPILGAGSDGAPIVFAEKTPKKGILGDMLGWCVGGGVGGALGGPEGAALGRIGGALGVALSALFDSITSDFSPYDDHLFEGSQDNTSTPGAQQNESSGMYGDHLLEKLRKDPTP